MMRPSRYQANQNVTGRPQSRPALYPTRAADPYDVVVRRDGGDWGVFVLSIAAADFHGECVSERVHHVGVRVRDSGLFLAGVYVGQFGQLDRRLCVGSPWA